MGFSRQKYLSGLPFPSPVDPVLSELSTMTHPSCVALHGMAHTFIQLDKAVIHVISLVSFLWLWFSVILLALWWIGIRGLWKLPDGRDWLRGKPGLVPMGEAMLSKSLIQSYGFSNNHVWMWELDYKKSQVPKNWCFWTAMLEKTLESPLDFKAIQPVHPKGNKSWIFIGRTDAEAEIPIFWLPDVKNRLIGKDPDAGKDWGQEEKGTTEDEMLK